MTTAWTDDFGRDASPEWLAAWACSDLCRADQDEEELAKLITWFREIVFYPQHVLEIGCLYGGTLDLWRALFPRAEILGVEMWPERELLNKGYDIIHADSRLPSTVEQVRGKMPQVELLHIDGDHDPDTFWSDFRKYGDFVHPGGIVLIHDTVGFLPEQWKQVVDAYPLSFEIACRDDGRCGIGVVRPGLELYSYPL